ncbi:MAG: long-chain fatty acid--CoA ligase, partial [Proteobacteria bacterium]|nr:long-chain fatty acid--CoA ligase [Pseudomonadota bacterium]
MTVVDAIRERARAQPQSAALVEARRDGGDRRLAYAELVESFETRARELTAAGLATGDRCGLLAPQGSEFIEAALGILAAGACLVPIPDDIGPNALAAFRQRTRLHGLLRVGGSEAGFSRFPDPGAVDGSDDRDYRDLRPAYLRFTSGTTSARKGVLLSHPGIQARLDAANRGLAIGPEDRIVWVLPLAHHFVVSILLYLREGARVLLPASHLARSVLELAEREAATVLYASPYHLRVFAKDTSELSLPSLRLAISTASGLAEDAATAFRARFGHAVTQALGIIEVGLPAINLARAESKPESVGAPLPDYDVWLRDEEGAPVRDPGPERTGEVCIRGPGLLAAY